MKFNQVKAPQPLKDKTLAIMQAQESNRIKRKPLKVALIVACVPMLFMLTAFAYSLFSGIDGDELSLKASYNGNGIVEIEVKNLAKKDLQFDKRIKLEQWSTSEEIFELDQVMPTIKPGESAVITIDIPNNYIDRIEVPLLDTDWYHFLFTTNHFMFGQTWTASLIFSEPIISDTEQSLEIPPLPIEDNTKEEDITAIKNNFKFQNPLSRIEITFDYNDYIDNGEYAHPRVSLKAERNDNIYSFCEGTVAETGFADDLGNYIIIDHGNGLKSQYTHCSELLKKQGDYIVMEDVIAKVGATGMATGPNLGFGITLNDIPINPKAFILE